MRRQESNLAEDDCDCDFSWAEVTGTEEHDVDKKDGVDAKSFATAAGQGG